MPVCVDDQTGVYLLCDWFLNAAPNECATSEIPPLLICDTHLPTKKICLLKRLICECADAFLQPSRLPACL